MKFLVVDDYEYKRDRICDYIKSVVGENADIEQFSCTREIMFYCHNLRKNDDKEIKCKDMMLFLDWNFPFYKNEHIESGAGGFVLSELQRCELPIKTVIVSSDIVKLDEEYDFVLGSIKDDCSVYQKPDYEKFIPKDLHLNKDMKINEEIR